MIRHLSSRSASPATSQQVTGTSRRGPGSVLALGLALGLASLSSCRDATDEATDTEAQELRSATEGSEIPRFTGDLSELRQRNVLRVLTRNNATTYFIHRGQLVGFEYDLARRFAKQLGLRLELVVPPSREDLLRWLLEGRGDIVAAGLTASAARARDEGVRFSRRYHAAAPTIVARAGEPAPSTLEALATRKLVVRKSSSYWRVLERLQKTGVKLDVVAAPEELETEEIIDRVASGTYDMTVADSHILAVELSWRTDIQKGLQLEEPQPHGWAVRPENPKLLQAIDAFFDREYRGVFYNVTRRKYFGNTARVRRQAALRPIHAGQISPYDTLARKHASRYGFDWRLIVAQMYQESLFDPKARSFAGARGLLQLMPRTARELGIKNLETPENGIRAGVAYLARMRDRFEAMPRDQKIWFALAAYNAGYGHVRDARKIAESQGLDPNRWFDNVEKAILLKQKPKFYQASRSGYCRCTEPVRYVRAIRNRYRAYRGALDEAETS